MRYEFRPHLTVLTGLVCCDSVTFRQVVLTGELQLFKCTVMVSDHELSTTPVAPPGGQLLEAIYICNTTVVGLAR